MQTSTASTAAVTTPGTDSGAPFPAAKHLGDAEATALVSAIRQWAKELGFSGIGISRADIRHAAPGFLAWLAAGHHGEMDYMARHAALRLDPAQLLPGTLSVLSVTLDYWPEAADARHILNSPDRAYLSRYALGRDYHKVIRNRLQKLGQRIAEAVAEYQETPLIYRAFSDSAPVLEVAFASQTTLGWRGKHSLLLSRRGSWQFLGELYLGLALPPDLPDKPSENEASKNHCGTCNRCITTCPTGAIIAPGQVDARRCISYLTIEFGGSIPVELRPLIGNRIYGCDDCQLECPWNRFATLGDPEFAVRHGLDNVTLESLFAWTADEFEQKLAGSPIRRIGHERWLRNIAVALGNVVAGGVSSASVAAIAALQTRLDYPSTLVQEHVQWGLEQIDRTCLEGQFGD